MRKQDIKPGGVYAQRRSKYGTAAKVEVIEVGVGASLRRPEMGPKDHSRVKVLQVGNHDHDGRIATVPNRSILGSWDEYVADEEKRQERIREESVRRRAVKERAEDVAGRLRHAGVEVRVDTFPTATLVIHASQFTALDDLLDRAAASS